MRRIALFFIGITGFVFMFLVQGIKSQAGENFNDLNLTLDESRHTSIFFDDSILQKRWKEFNSEILIRMTLDDKNASVGTGAACPIVNDPEILYQPPWPAMTDTQAASCIYRLLESSRDEDEIARKMNALGFEVGYPVKCSLKFNAMIDNKLKWIIHDLPHKCDVYGRSYSIYKGFFAFFITRHVVLISRDGPKLQSVYVYANRK